MNDFCRVCVLALPRDYPHSVCMECTSYANSCVAKKDSAAIKHDNEKPPIGLIPGVALKDEARAFADGRKKYGQWNYKKGMEWTRVIDAALRHIIAFKEGEDVAPDSGVHHLGHARACLGMLLDYYHNELGTDDRYKNEVPETE